jgi:RNA polymerase sigma-70 factor (ECF subfamily)
MLYTHARRAARRDASGFYVPLEEQDANLWDDSALAAAEAELGAANAHGPSGRYQIEAAIQSAHVARRLLGIDNAKAVLALYDHLLTLTRSPVVGLNRAVALAEIAGPGPALDAIAALAADPRMQSYQPYWAARGHLLARAGRAAEAVEALTVAIGLSTDDPVRGYLVRRRDEIGRPA